MADQMSGYTGTAMPDPGFGAPDVTRATRNTGTGSTQRKRDKKKVPAPGMAAAVGKGMPLGGKVAPGPVPVSATQPAQVPGSMVLDYQVGVPGISTIGNAAALGAVDGVGRRGSLNRMGQQRRRYPRV